MKELFNEHNFNRKTRSLLNTVNDMLEDYQDRGYSMTLRQLYYQLVANDIIPNNDREYKKIGSMLTNARYAGLVDWEIIEDRLRKPRRNYTLNNAEHAVRDAIRTFEIDKMIGQSTYVEVWGEKDAISNILYNITSEYSIRLMINRGYSSTTAIYDAYKRFATQMEMGNAVKILYVGDHDPSGLDMIDDINERVVHMLTNGDRNPYLECTDFEVVPIALTREQIDLYQPPPNPTKLTDTRSQWYIQEHGHECWEVDALRPDVLEQVVEDAIREHINIDQYEHRLKIEEEEKDKLRELTKNL